MSNGISKQVIQTGGGSGTPGGADTQIQVNDGGVFAGFANFVWDKINSLILGEGNSDYVYIKGANAAVPGNGGTNIYLSAGDDSLAFDGFGGEYAMNGGSGQSYGGGFSLNGGQAASYGVGGGFSLGGGSGGIGGSMNFRPGIGYGIVNGVMDVSIDNQGAGYSVGSILLINGGSNDAYLKVTEVDVGGEILELYVVAHGNGYSITTGATTITFAGGSGATININSLISGGNGKFTIEHPTSGFKAELNVDALTADQTYTLQDGSGTLAFLSQIGKDEFGLTVDGAGAVVTTGSKGFRYMGYDGTITGWNVTSDVSGSIVFDIKRSGASIAGTEKPTLSSQSSNSDLTLTTWTTAITAGDELEFIVDSASTVTRATLTILITKAP